MKRYIQDNSYFESIDTERKAYWLGFLYADGCVYEKNENSKSVILELHPDDKYLIEAFIKDIKSDRPICTNKRGYVSVYISSTKMANDLIKLGCIPRKSLVLKFPTEEIVPSKLINHFIRGYMDGDGCISTYYKLIKGRHNPNFVCEIKFIGTHDMLEGIREYFNSDKKVLFNKHSEKSCQISFRGKKYLDKVCSLYEGATIYMVRKKQKLDGYINYLDEANYQADGKSVVQLDFNGNKICTYKNASRAEAFDSTTIGRCCKCEKGYYSYKGFKWMYESDYNKINSINL